MLSRNAIMLYLAVNFVQQQKVTLCISYAVSSMSVFLPVVQWSTTFRPAHQTMHPNLELGAPPILSFRCLMLLYLRSDSLFEAVL